jgi:L-fuconolactonase
VLVQHLGEFDNRYLQRAVSDRPERFTAIALVDHRRSDWPETLDRLAAARWCSGVRIPQAALAENLTFCEGALARSLVAMFDLPGGMRGGAAIPRLAQRYPDVPVVISHMGYPKVENEELVSGREVLELSGLRSVSVLISGQSMFCGYPYMPLAALREELIAAFGPDRVMWGSNFPEATDADQYLRDLSLIASLPSLSTACNLEKVMGQTAGRVFFGSGEA